MNTMNKLAVIGLIVIVIFGISFFAFTRVTNERYLEPAPMEPTSTEPSPELEAIYKGTILEINEGNILTNGIEGIVGDVVVHLPEDFNAPMIIEPGMVLHVRYDGRIAESYPMQIWATEIIATEESQLPILEPIEEPKVIPLPSHVVRFTIENAIQSIPVGEAFEVVLHVNPTTGYLTELSYPDTLVLLSDVYVSQAKSSTLVGVGSTRILQFKSESLGSHEITCEVIEPSGEIAHTYAIEVEIIE
jgi:predicted secreted protein